MDETNLTRHVRLNSTYSVDISYRRGQGLLVEWEPEVPTKKLGPKEARKYRQARDALLAEVALHLGGNVMVVEL